jgi:hypothetical protein
MKLPDLIFAAIFDEHAELAGLRGEDLREPLFAFPAGNHDHHDANRGAW